VGSLAPLVVGQLAKMKWIRSLLPASD